MFSQAGSQVRNRLVAFSLLVPPAVSSNASTSTTLANYVLSVRSL